MSVPILNGKGNGGGRIVTIFVQLVLFNARNENLLELELTRFATGTLLELSISDAVGECGE